MIFEFVSLDNLYKQSCLSSAGLAGVSFLCLLCSYIAYQRLFSPLAKIPGPFFASISNLWLLKVTRSLNRHRVEIDLHQKYGPIVRVSPNEVIIASPSAVKPIYGAGSRFYKSAYYGMHGCLLLNQLQVVSQIPDPFAAPNPEDWGLLGERNQDQYHRHRRLIGKTYSMGSVKTLEHLMDSSISFFVKRMKEMGGKSIDVVYWMNLFAIDLLTETSFSERAGLLGTGDDQENIELLDDLWIRVHWMGLYPGIFRFIQWMATHLLHFDITGLSIPIAHHCVKQLKNRVAKGKPMPKPDLVDRLIQLHHEKPEFVDSHLQTMTITNLMAGFDTMSATISSVIVWTVRTKNCQARLHAELDLATKEGRLSRPPTYDEVARLPYLQACILEGARLHGVIGISLPRIVPQSGVTIDGQYIPAGYTVGCNIWIIHRDKSVYGEDAEEFNPERWTEADPIQRAEMERHSLVFGGDSRSCPGKRISPIALRGSQPDKMIDLAWVAVSKAVTAMFREFDIEFAEEQKEIDERCFFVVKWRNITMKFRSRT